MDFSRSGERQRPERTTTRWCSRLRFGKSLIPESHWHKPHLPCELRNHTRPTANRHARGVTPVCVRNTRMKYDAALNPHAQPTSATL